MPWTGTTRFFCKNRFWGRVLAPLLALLVTCLTLSGCVSSVHSDLPLGEMPAASIVSAAALAASPAHPDAVLPLDSVEAGDRVEIVGTSPDGDWLLVFTGRAMGWLPSAVAGAGSLPADSPVVIAPLDGSCTQYLGASFAPSQSWRADSAQQMIVVGSIYRLTATPDFVDASLTVSVGGGGKASVADYLSLPLTRETSLVLFAYALDGLTPDSEVTFLLDDPAREPLVFQAAFFADDCGKAWDSMGGGFASQLPIGEASLEIPGQRPNPQPQQMAGVSAIRPIAPKTTPTRTPPKPVATPTRASGPSRAEIQRLVDEWDRIHHDADYSLDGSELSMVLTGDALRQQQKTLQSLRDSRCYWDFSDLEPSQITGWDEVSDSEIIVTMRKHWDGRLYCNGKLDQKGSFDEPFDVRYRIVLTQAGWRIAEKVPLDE